MFGSAVRKVTETNSSLPALIELPSHQELAGIQLKTMEKRSRWSIFGKFKVDSEKTLETNYRSNACKKCRGAAVTPRTINPYELRNQELKMEEYERSKRKVFNWKVRQQQKLRMNTVVLDVSKILVRKLQKGPRMG